MTIHNATSTPWQLRPDEFPVEAPVADRARFLLRYAILAPSSHNTQPWRFSVTDESIRCFADPARWLKIADADKRELHLSLGCALENLLVAAEHYGLGHTVERFPDRDDEELAAVVELSRNGTRSDLRPPELFDAITKRCTNRRLYGNNDVVPQHRKAMADVSNNGQVHLKLFDDPQRIERLEELMVRADMLQFADPAWRQELGDWLGRGAFGTTWLMSKLSRIAVTHLNLGEFTGENTARTVRSAPLFGLILTPTDDPTHRLLAGQAIERLWLQATVLDTAVHPMNQVLQVPQVRQQFVEQFGFDDLIPQMVLRLGHAEPVKARTPRRPLREVLL